MNKRKMGIRSQEARSELSFHFVPAQSYLVISIQTVYYILRRSTASQSSQYKKYQEPCLRIKQDVKPTPEGKLLIPHIDRLCLARNPYREAHYTSVYDEPIGTASHQSSPSLPDSPTPQKKTPASPSKSKSTPKKRTTAPSAKTEVTGTSFPSKKSPAKKAGGGGAGKAGATNITMAADVVKHALTLVNADELKVVAEKLGVDPVKLRDVSRIVSYGVGSIPTFRISRTDNDTSSGRAGYVTLVLEEELAVSPTVYAAETSPRARSGKFLIPVNLTLVLERSKRQIPSLESTTPSRTKGNEDVFGKRFRGSYLCDVRYGP